MHKSKKLHKQKKEILKNLKKEKPAPDGHYVEPDGTIKKIIDNINNGKPYLL